MKTDFVNIWILVIFVLGTYHLSGRYIGKGLILFFDVEPNNFFFNEKLYAVVLNYHTLVASFDMHYCSKTQSCYVW